MEDISNMTEDEKREAAISWVNNLDEFALDEILVEFCGLGDEKSTAQHQPEPPTLRPMSELPQARERYLFKRVSRASEEKYISGVLFSSSTGFYVVTDDEKFYFSKDDFKQKASSMQIVGWLPLPNPNEIKPC